MDMIDFSIVIPVYNEERRIPPHIDEIFNFFRSKKLSTEIIFVNDGSRDRTEEVLLGFKNTYEFALVSYPLNRGKGYAVRQGALHARGKWIIFFDIDLATPLTEFDHLLDFMNPDDQIVVGSRRLASSAITKSESSIRTFLGHGFTKISNFLVPGITDFTCGFKAFSREAAEIIFQRARIDRWGFDTELLYIAHLHGLHIRQMPVVWAHDADSKVTVWKAVVSSLKELFEMKFNQLMGLYR